MLVRDLVQDRDERAGRLEHVELGVEEGSRPGCLGQDELGGRFGIGKSSVHDEEVLQEGKGEGFRQLKNQVSSPCADCKTHLHAGEN